MSNVNANAVNAKFFARRNVETIAATAAQRKQARKLLAALTPSLKREVTGRKAGEYNAEASRARRTGWFDAKAVNPEYVGLYQVSLDGERSTEMFAKWDGAKWTNMNTGKRLTARKMNQWRGLTTQGYAAYLKQVADGQRELIAIPKQ